MTDDDVADVGAVLDLEPDDLDGHSIEELMAYLDAGRTPPDPSIESSPACRIALAALLRLRVVTAGLVTADGDDPVDDRWVESVLAGINVDARAGRDVVVAETDRTTVVMTEAALKALVRSVGDDLPGLLIGRVRLSGDLERIGPVTIGVEVNVVEGVPIPAAVDALRTAVRASMARHTRFAEPTVDITVTDLQPRPRGGAE